MDTTALAMRNISMQFSGVYALRDMQLDVQKAEVHALVGENGAGKSTLIKVLGGVYKPKTGKIFINGEETQISGIQDAHEKGINIIHQEICLVPYLSIAENIFLGREILNKYGFNDKHQMVVEAQRMINDLNIELDAAAKVNTLTIAQQQLVEIIKAISFNTKILVMDEPTSSLSLKETEKLFETIGQLKGNGVSIIYISHRMEEIFSIADTVTVIRDGCYVDTRAVAEVTADEIVTMMVGRSVENYYTRTYNALSETALEVRHLCKHGVFEDVSFVIHEGEILGFAGLVGAGRSEIMMSIFGADPFDEGEVYLDGRKVRFKNTREAIKAGLGLVPESRKEQGLVLPNTAGYNIALASLDALLKGKLISRKKWSDLAELYFQKLDIKARSYHQLMFELSGGNQQKVVLGKWLATAPRVLILDEPTRGVDVGAKSEIYAIMNKLAEQGMAIIMVSSELAEIINMCDNVCVVHEGRITGRLAKEDFTQDNIMKYATGGVR